MDDPTQVNALLVNVSVPPTGVPESVRVKYVWDLYIYMFFFSDFFFFLIFKGICLRLLFRIKRILHGLVR